MVDPNLTCVPLTPEHWEAFERLFGPKGACGGCWCMYWNLSHTTFEAQQGEPNRLMMKARVESGEIPGILAFAGEEPVGWCAVAPRQDYSRLAKSRLLKPIDQQPVWSIVCFFVARPYRRKGVTARLIQGALDFAQQHGAHIVEAYPIEPDSMNAPPVFIYTGVASAFRKAGFTEAARRSPTRPIFRYTFE